MSSESIFIKQAHETGEVNLWIEPLLRKEADGTITEIERGRLQKWRIEKEADKSNHEDSLTASDGQ